MDDLQGAPGAESTGEELFLNHLQNWGKDEATPSEDQVEEVQEEEVEPQTEAEEVEDEATPSEAAEEEAEATEEPTYTYADDSHHVSVRVGDEEHTVSVKDLKRLWGQESSITKKGQELATQRAAYEAEVAVTTAAQNHLLDNARKRFEPYAKLDFLALSRDNRVSTEQFQALRAEATARHEEVQFLEQQARSYAEGLQVKAREAAVAEAKASVAALTDPKSAHHIEGWNQGVYDELRQYAVSRGIPEQIVNGVTNAAVIKMFHTAMQAEKGASLKAVKTVKVGTQVKKIMKNTSAPASAVKQSVGDKTKFGDRNKAMSNLKRSGSMADAENAFFASFREFESN